MHAVTTDNYRQWIRDLAHVTVRLAVQLRVVVRSVLLLNQPAFAGQYRHDMFCLKPPGLTQECIDGTVVVSWIVKQ